MKKEVEEFYNSAPENFKETLNKLSSTILGYNKDITQEIKWKKLTFGLKDDFHHWLCQIGFTKKATCLYFHFGGLLEDKDKIFIKGESKLLRKIEFPFSENVDVKIVREYLVQAINKLDYFKKNWKKLI